MILTEILHRGAAYHTSASNECTKSHASSNTNIKLDEIFRQLYSWLTVKVSILLFVHVECLTFDSHQRSAWRVMRILIELSTFAHSDRLTCKAEHPQERKKQQQQQQHKLSESSESTHHLMLALNLVCVSICLVHVYFIYHMLLLLVRLLVSHDLNWIFTLLHFKLHEITIFYIGPACKAITGHYNFWINENQPFKPNQGS